MDYQDLAGDAAVVIDSSAHVNLNSPNAGPTYHELNFILLLPKSIKAGASKADCRRDLYLQAEIVIEKFEQAFSVTGHEIELTTNAYNGTDGKLRISFVTN